MAYLPLTLGLPPILGGISADLQALFADELLAYESDLRLRPRKRGPKVINDSVWKTIRLEAWEVAVLDSPVLQRLRDIQQLGLAHLVFSGASYSRLEHSIGALHQAHRLSESINNNARSAGRSVDPIGPADQTLLRLAALLHDIGHGFLSHVSERAMHQISDLPGGGSVDDARGAAQALFRCRKKPAFAEVLAALLTRLPEFVRVLDVAEVQHWSDPENLSLHLAHLIVGATPYGARPFLAEVISGAVDADKLDYMARDCQMAGIPMPVDVERVLQKVQAVGIPASDELVRGYCEHYGLDQGQTIYLFAVDLTGGKTVEEMVVSRVLLYDKLYHHQKVRAFEGMVENALRTLIASAPAFSKGCGSFATADLGASRSRFQSVMSRSVTVAAS